MYSCSRYGGTRTRYYVLRLVLVSEPVLLRGVYDVRFQLLTYSLCLSLLLVFIILFADLLSCCGLLIVSRVDEHNIVISVASLIFTFVMYLLPRNNFTRSVVALYLIIVLVFKTVLNLENFSLTTITSELKFENLFSYLHDATITLKRSMDNYIFRGILHDSNSNKIKIPQCL